MNKVFIPLGVTCSTAFILRDRFKVRDFSLPFDWVDLNLTGLYNMLNTEADNIDKHLTGYFAMVGAQKHVVDGTWFPHDLIKGVTVEEVRDKYIRRMKRLFGLFESSNELIFLTTFHDINPNRHESFEKLKNLISDKTKNDCYFITANVNDFDLTRIDEIDGRKMFYRNIVVPFNGDWSQGEQKALFEQDVYEAITKDDAVNQLFKKTQ